MFGCFMLLPPVSPSSSLYRKGIIFEANKPCANKKHNCNFLHLNHVYQIGTFKENDYDNNNDPTD